MPKKSAPIPLWLATHEAAHVVARIQLAAARYESGLERPGCMEDVRVWVEPDGTPRGNCVWGYKEPLSFPYQAIGTAAGPIAEARARGDVSPLECLRSSQDFDIIANWVRRGAADLKEAMVEGSRIVEKCWPDIEKLAAYLQQNRKAAFSDVSELLDLPNGRCIYTTQTRPSSDYRRPASATAPHRIPGTRASATPWSSLRAKSGAMDSPIKRRCERGTGSEGGGSDPALTHEHASGQKQRIRPREGR